MRTHRRGVLPLTPALTVAPGLAPTPNPAPTPAPTHHPQDRGGALCTLTPTPLSQPPASPFHPLPLHHYELCKLWCHPPAGSALLGSFSRMAKMFSFSWVATTRAAPQAKAAQRASLAVSSKPASVGTSPRMSFVAALSTLMFTCTHASRGLEFMAFTAVHLNPDPKS